MFCTPCILPVFDRGNPCFIPAKGRSIPARERVRNARFQSFAFLLFPQVFHSRFPFKKFYRFSSIFPHRTIISDTTKKGNCPNEIFSGFLP